MLTGPINGQIELAERLLRSAPLGRRYVLQRDGAVVGMGALATRDEPRPDVPARVLLGAPAVMGPLHGLRSLFGAVRGVLTIAPP
ncbi:MAG TPA: hypothetical protein VFZ00_34670, partial [Solirubrobacter sp.]|nr:hypothetical protein [Solirubrobacter sp.]